MEENIRQIVMFKLANEIYGIDIQKVHEIITVKKITRIPRTKFFINGVINLRGKIVPIFDLRKRLNLLFKDFDEETRIIIIDVEQDIAGIIVDGISEVLSISQDKIETPSPLVASSVEAEYLEGVINLGEKFIVILNIDKILVEKGKEDLLEIGNKISVLETKEIPSAIKQLPMCCN